ncbi:MAG: nicotinamide-nucleotide adenylyltransferase [Candidatus Methanofastidiosia archaeon]
MRALYIGRFQPFHLGHLQIVKEILGNCKELIIAIGSAQISHTFENPFTAGERFLMIKKALENEGIDLSRVHILPIYDTKRHSIWVEHLKSLTPEFDVVYSNEPLTTRLFKEANYKVRTTELIKRESYSGENIRKYILSGKNWKEFVPKGVAEVIRDIGGVERIFELARTDKPKNI